MLITSELKKASLILLASWKFSATEIQFAYTNCINTYVSYVVCNFLDIFFRRLVLKTSKFAGSEFHWKQAGRFTKL